MSPGHNKLIAEMLPAQFVIRGSIENMPECNYELYLTEFLNASSFFMGKTFNNPFVFQEDQSKGQCDCYAQIDTDKYGLDFKLFGSEKALQGKSIFSSQIIKVGQGAYAFAVPKERGSITGTWILSVLKDRSFDELEMISNNVYQSDPANLIEREIQGVLKKLKVRKNLFLFLTNRFHFPEGFSVDFIKELDDLCLSLSERLEHVIAFRNKFAEGHDTYFSFIFEDKLIITECNNGKLKKADCIPLSQSKVFWDLNTILNPFGGIKLRRE